MDRGSRRNRGSRRRTTSCARISARPASRPWARSSAGAAVWTSARRGPPPCSRHRTGSSRRSRNASASSVPCGAGARRRCVAVKPWSSRPPRPASLSPPRPAFQSPPRPRSPIRGGQRRCPPPGRRRTPLPRSSRRPAPLPKQTRDGCSGRRSRSTPLSPQRPRHPGVASASRQCCSPSASCCSRWRRCSTWSTRS